ncbi:MAG: Sec-independent protein translocase protein TatA [Candidatus Woesebacteria bacterium GW2011_GWB1_43_14]|uniref:Sec-independent protein translocase protein TatA n=1 Tax=Candidatus Woesebacteria bacterium GW2011_GWB1_43_14 TaxID=1618578 RepID=A0A0G1DMF5_9BACT|nr:MAG: Sec-independent protein translocase protein TatA [Candidatus Woesebacteria bacterium GW2011_GWB1_43_14]
MLNFVKNIGPTELIVLLAIVVILFGRKIAVGLGRSTGQSLKEIKKIKNELTGAAGEIMGNGKDDQKGV